MRAHLVILGAAGLLAVGGCESSNLIDASETFSGRIVEGDTTMLQGESATLTSRAEYRFGEGLPIEIVWGQSDTAVIGLVGLAGGAVQATAKKAGTSLIVARINQDFLDTITVTVVDTGAVRWRRTLAAGGTQGVDVAINDSGHVVTTDGTQTLIVLRDTGDTVRTAGGACPNLTGPVVTGNGFWSSGTGCTARFSVDGTQVFSRTFGGTSNRVAVAANGDVIVLARTAAADTTLALSRYDISGNLVWRDTLRSANDVVDPQGGVALASNGDIYVVWAANTGYLSRVTSGGAARWTQALPSAAVMSAPAVVGTRVYVTHLSGVAARDSAGAVVYDRTYASVGAGLPALLDAPTPVVDNQDNVYVLHGSALFSLDGTGAVRWVNDSVARGSNGNEAPAILTGNGLVMMCEAFRACGVNSSTGALQWRGPAVATAGTQHGSIAVGPSGQLYVKVDNEIIALWHRRNMVSTGWPTLGGNRGRSGTGL